VGGIAQDDEVDLIMARNLTFNVAPRFTAGSPAPVDMTTALRVASQEKDAYEHAKEGIYGEGDQKKANDQGLHLIVFEMHETAKGWNVHDVLTDKQWFWPFEAKCPGCKTKLRCKRGFIEAHQTGNSVYNPCARDNFVGKELKDENRFVSVLSENAARQLRSKRP
jgi:hypothetical protein